jgi:hypothetical protein
MPRCFKGSLSLRIRYQNCVCTSPRCATCLTHLILCFITRITLGEEYGKQSSSLCSLLHSSITSSLLGQHMFLCTLFSNTLSLCSSLSVRDQVLYPYKTTRKLHFCIFQSLYFWIPNWKKKDSAQNDSKHSLSSINCKFMYECSFDFLQLFPNISTHLFEGFIIYLYVVMLSCILSDT